MDILKVLYSAKLEIQPRPSALTYLAHHPVAPLFNEKKDLKDLMRRHDYGKDTIIPYNAILSHFISTSGRSGFDHILKVLITIVPLQNHLIQVYYGAHGLLLLVYLH